jgi:quaternary ammonium compound-resistance protein SugE
VIAAGLTARAIALFVVVVVGQIGGSVLLARTAGFTSPGWSLLCAAVYVVSLYCLALLLHEGAALSLLMPLMAAVVPMGAILLAVVWLGEGASWARLGLLTLSCAVVALASRV